MGLMIQVLFASWLFTFPIQLAIVGLWVMYTELREENKGTGSKSGAGSPFERWIKR